MEIKINHPNIGDIGEAYSGHDIFSFEGEGEHGEMIDLHVRLADIESITVHVNKAPERETPLEAATYRGVDCPGRQIIFPGIETAENAQKC